MIAHSGRVFLSYLEVHGSHTNPTNVQTCSTKLENKVSRMNLPDGQNDRTPQESIFKLARGPQLPYTSKYFLDGFITQIN